MVRYILDQTWEAEAERLRGLERWADPTTVDHLTRLGVGPGWRCLEVGGGAGSIARWLAERTRPGGQVTTIDLDTTLLEPLPDQGVEVIRADLLQDPLPGGFDLVHARLVIGHLHDRRREGLERLVEALRPGGLLLVEENDFVWTEVDSWPCHPERHGELMTRIWRANIDFWRAGGYDGHWGRRLVGALRDLGLDGVAGEARSPIDGSGTTVARLSIERFRDQHVAAGRLTNAEVDAYLAALSEPDMVMTSPLQVSAWGRRPG
jgi:SAM-dependent methyltransferase